MSKNRLSDALTSNDEVTYCKESETCCNIKEEDETHEDSIVIEDNEIPKTVNRQCGQRSYIGMESRISDGDTADYGMFSLKQFLSNVEIILDFF